MGLDSLDSLDPCVCVSCRVGFAPVPRCHLLSSEWRVASCGAQPQVIKVECRFQRFQHIFFQRPGVFQLFKVSLQDWRSLFWRFSTMNFPFSFFLLAFLLPCFDIVFFSFALPPCLQEVGFRFGRCPAIINVGDPGQAKKAQPNWALESSEQIFGGENGGRLRLDWNTLSQEVPHNVDVWYCVVSFWSARTSNKPWSSLARQNGQNARSHSVLWCKLIIPFSLNLGHSIRSFWWQAKKKKRLEEMLVGAEPPIIVQDLERRATIAREPHSWVFVFLVGTPFSFRF